MKWRMIEPGRVGANEEADTIEIGKYGKTTRPSIVSSGDVSRGAEGKLCVLIRTDEGIPVQLDPSPSNARGGDAEHSNSRRCYHRQSVWFATWSISKIGVLFLRSQIIVLRWPDVRALMGLIRSSLPSPPLQPRRFTVLLR